MTNNYKSYVIKTIIAPGILIAVIVAIFVSLPSYYLVEEVDKKEQSLNRLEVKYRSLYSEVRFLMDQYALFKKYGDQFYDLEARGIVGDVKRLKWIDALLLFSHAYGFNDMSSTLLPYTPVGKVRLGSKQVSPKLFYLNPVRFSADLPVDVDFIRLASFIEKDISPFYFFKECTFSDNRVSDLYKVDPKKVGMFSLKGGSDSSGAVDIQCVFNVITSKPRKRTEK